MCLNFWQSLGCTLKARGAKTFRINGSCLGGKKKLKKAAGARRQPLSQCAAKTCCNLFAERCALEINNDIGKFGKHRYTAWVPPPFTNLVLKVLIRSTLRLLAKSSPSHNVLDNESIFLTVQSRYPEKFLNAAPTQRLRHTELCSSLRETKLARLHASARAKPLRDYVHWALACVANGALTKMQCWVRFDTGLFLFPSSRHIQRQTFCSHPPISFDHSPFISGC